MKKVSLQQVARVGGGFVGDVVNHGTMININGSANIYLGTNGLVVGTQGNGSFSCR